MIILFLMMLCTTYCAHSMHAMLDREKGQLKVTGFDQIYSNRSLDDGKGGTTICSEKHPLCLLATFIADNQQAQEDVMLPIETMRDVEQIPDDSQVSFCTHGTNKKMCVVMCPLLRDKIREALRPK